MTLRLLIVLTLLFGTVSGCVQSAHEVTAAPTTFDARYSSPDGSTIELALGSSRLVADRDLVLRPAYPLTILVNSTAMYDAAHAPPNPFTARIRYWLDGQFDVVRRDDFCTVLQNCKTDSYASIDWKVQGNPAPFGVGLQSRLSSTGALDYTLAGQSLHAQVNVARDGAMTTIQFPSSAKFAGRDFLNQNDTTYVYQGERFIPKHVGPVKWTPSDTYTGPSPSHEMDLVEWTPGPPLEPILNWPKNTQSQSETKFDGFLFPGAASNFFDTNSTPQEALDSLRSHDSDTANSLKTGGCIRSFLMYVGSIGSTNPMGPVPPVALTRSVAFDIMYQEGATSTTHDWLFDHNEKLGQVRTYEFPSMPKSINHSEQYFGTCPVFRSLSSPTLTGDAFWRSAKNLPITSHNSVPTGFQFENVHGLLVDHFAAPAGILEYSAAFSAQSAGLSIPMLANRDAVSGWWLGMVIRPSDVDAIDHVPTVAP